MAVRIGANPIGWSNDDMRELGGHISLEQCLTEAKAAGYQGMELGNKFPRQISALKSVLSAHALELAGGWYSTFLLERDAENEFREAQAHMRLLRGMGCSVFIAAECTRSVHGDRAKPLNRRPVLNGGEWKHLAQNLTRFAEMVAGEDLQVVYHPHMGTVVQSEAEIDRLMEMCGASVHLLLDTGHATWGGADPAALAKRFRSRIGHVHTKDVRGEVMAEADRHGWSFLDSVIAGVYTVPGDGMVDFAGVFKALKGYSGWVVVEAEQDPNKAPPAKYARMGHDHVAAQLKEARLV
ncbi:MAG: myo-inosose-2 dehydratase [Pseudomonadota bacterium]|nr:myo-inosose-2 dehydratase [Pseudomonadota bacterium]